MITNVYIIRKGLDSFFVIDPESDNWSWSPDIEEATIFITPDKAESTRISRKTGNDTYVYEMPYSVPTTQQRRKKITKKRIKRRIKKSKPKNKR